MAQAFSRANMHVEHHQVNAELRQLPPPLTRHNGWAGQQQQQPVRPNGRLAAGALPHSSSTTSRPMQVTTAQVRSALPRLGSCRPRLAGILRYICMSCVCDSACIARCLSAPSALMSRRHSQHGRLLLHWA